MRKRQKTILLLLSTLVVLGTTYGILLSLRSTSEQVRSASFKTFDAAVGSRDFATADIAVREYGSSFRATDLLFLPPFPRKRAGELDQLTQRLEQVRALLQTLSQPSFEAQDVLPLVQVLTEGSRQKKITQVIQKWQQSINELNTSEVERIRLQEGEARVWDVLTLLKKDYRKLLQLPEPEEEIVESIELFQRGFLQGLPILPELSQAPESAQELAEILKSQEVPLPQLSATAFQERLEALRSSFSTTIDELDSMDEKILFLNERVTTLIQEQRKHYEEVYRLLKGPHADYRKDDCRSHAHSPIYSEERHKLFDRE